MIMVIRGQWKILTGSEASLSMVLRLTPRGVDGGGMTVSSRVVLLPSITEAASMLGSSMMVWSMGQMSRINIRKCPRVRCCSEGSQIFKLNLPITSLCWPMTSSLGTSGFSSSLRNSSKLSASPPFLLFLSSSGTKGVRQRVNIW